MNIYITKYNHFIIILIFFSIFSFAIDEQALNQYLNWGKFYINLKKYEKATTYYEKVIKMDPYNQIALDNLAIISEKTGYVPEEMDETPPPIKTKIGEAYQWYLNGMIQFKKGEFDKAAEAFINAYAKAPEEEAYRIWAYKSKRKFEFDEYKKKQKQSEENIDLKKIYDELSSKEIVLNEETSRQWYLRASFSFNHDQIEKAIDELKISLLYNPKNPEAISLQDNIEISVNQKLEKTLKETTPEPIKTVDETPEVVVETEKAIINESQSAEKKTEKQKAENREKETDIFPVKRDLKYINTYDRVTLNENITLDNHILAGMFELTDEEKRLSSEVEKLFNEAKNLFTEKKYALMTEKLESAYQKVNDVNPDDYRSLYYLYLINDKKRDLEKMKKYLFKMTKALTKTYYHNGKWYNKCKELADCLFYQLIIQSAYTAYKLRNKDGEFKFSSLKHEGYLALPEHKTVILDFMGEKFKWKFSHIHHDDFYELKGNTINCKLHGQNPILTEEFSVVEE